MNEPDWLRDARKNIGERETLGPNDSPFIRKILDKFNAQWLKGQPWCGGAVAYWMSNAGFEPPQAWFRAKAWLDWGIKQRFPSVGSVVVFEREGGGHVGLVVGVDGLGRLLVLGGNQGDSVKISPFDKDRVSGYRWPSNADWPASDQLPVYANAEASSRNEA